MYTLHSLAYLQDLITALAGVLAYTFYQPKYIVIKSCRYASECNVYMHLVTFGQADSTQYWLVDDS